MATAFANCGVLVDQLLEAISAEAIPKLSEFNVQDLSLTAWAMSKLGFLHLHLLDSIAAASIPKLHDADG